VAGYGSYEKGAIDSELKTEFIGDSSWIEWL